MLCGRRWQIWSLGTRGSKPRPRSKGLLCKGFSILLTTNEISRDLISGSITSFRHCRCWVPNDLYSHRHDLSLYSLIAVQAVDSPKCSIKSQFNSDLSLKSHLILLSNSLESLINLLLGQSSELVVPSLTICLWSTDNTNLDLALLEVHT